MTRSSAIGDFPRRLMQAERLVAVLRESDPGEVRVPERPVLEAALADLAARDRNEVLGLEREDAHALAEVLHAAVAAHLLDPWSRSLRISPAGAARLRREHGLDDDRARRIAHALARHEADGA